MGTFIDEESNLLTIFATPFGRYCWHCLQFGLNVSSEIFQKGLYEGFEGVRCVTDDILVLGRTDEEHDAQL